MRRSDRQEGVDGRDKRGHGGGGGSGRWGFVEQTVDVGEEAGDFDADAGGVGVDAVWLDEVRVAGEGGEEEGVVEEAGAVAEGGEDGGECRAVGGA